MKIIRSSWLQTLIALLVCTLTSQAPFFPKYGAINSVRSQLMYPYDKSDYLEHIDMLHSEQLILLDFVIPYFGSHYNYAYISLHGSIFFEADLPEMITYPLKFPSLDWPLKPDPSFIGVFFSKSSIATVSNASLPSGVYFRKYRDIGRTSENEASLKEAIKQDIREGIIGASEFDPRHVIIVTWKNVSFYESINSKHFNTYQLLLATDEIRTYAIFNYDEINWTSNPESGGDTVEGEGGTSAYVGFNGGNGTRAYEYLPYSQGTEIKDILTKGYVNEFPGKHIFRMDEEILQGACNFDLESNQTLVISPEAGNMLGGIEFNISGPCFSPNEEITLHFGDQQIKCIYRSRNLATCYTPRVYTNGFVDVSVWQTRMGTRQFKNKFYIENPVIATEYIWFDNNFILNHSNLKEFKIYWNPRNLSSHQEISINLWGYKEDSSKPELVFIDTLIDRTLNDGFEMVDVEKLQDRDKGLLRNLHVGFIQINGTSSSNQSTPNLWSRPMSLGWYFKKQWENYYGLTWAERFCEDWFIEDQYLDAFADELPQCPCNLAQALTDLRFVPDPYCDMHGNTECYESRQILHCVRSGQPSANGGGQHCCYGMDTYLVMNYDGVEGGFPSRSHLFGSREYNETTKVPGLSHLYHDLRPLYMCCKWQEEMTEGCYRFKSLRASQDCKGYNPPNASTVFGDPHFITFNDLEYTFNGLGEYSLVNIHDKNHVLNIQGRFEQLSDKRHSMLAASQLTAIVAKENKSSTVEIQIRQKSNRGRYHLSVLIDNKRVYFDRSHMKTINGATVYTPSNILNQSRIIVTFESGATVEVGESYGHIFSRIYLPESFKNSTKGLFGNWSDDIRNNFVLPSGQIIPHTSTDEQLYNEFGLKWAVNDSEETEPGMKSLFYHEFDRTSATYLNGSYVPEFNRHPNLSPNAEEDVINVCGFELAENYQCIYDYIMTHDEEFARSTSYNADRFRRMKKEDFKKIVTCEALPTPCHGRKNTPAYTVGTVVEYECEKGYVLEGDPVRWCLESGEWSTLMSGVTRCKREGTDETLRKNGLVNHFCS